MATKKRAKHHGIADTAERTRQRMEHARSGAAGTHADQTTRRLAAAGRTNRIGSRSAQRRVAVNDWR